MRTTILARVTDQEIPAEVLATARERADARSRRDWPTADRLRDEIAAAGFKVVDEGDTFRLERAHPPDVVDDGAVRYGSSASVPSRLDEPDLGLATIVLVADEHPQDAVRAIGAIADHAPDGVQIVVVANGASNAGETALGAVASLDPGEPGVQTELIMTSARLGHAAALNAGIRRAEAPVIVLLDGSVEPTGDFVSPLVEALDADTVAVAGGWGITSGDLRHFQEAPAGDVDAIELYCLAFRRRDYVARGPLDEAFRYYRNLDIWWSLVLRDGEGEPRRAVAIELPLRRHEHRGWTSVEPDERERLSRRNFYRIIRQFGSRRDLLLRPAAGGWREARAAAKER